MSAAHPYVSDHELRQALLELIDHMIDVSPDVASFRIRGHQFKVTATEHRGVDSGRVRYRVECESCVEVEHEATTGAAIRVVQHLERER